VEEEGCLQDYPHYVTEGFGMSLEQKFQDNNSLGVSG